MTLKVKAYAVVAAAGLSSRMGACKPLLPIRGIPAAAFLLRTLLASGVSSCILVTGSRRAEVEAACSGLSGVTFVHNPDFAGTQMLDSAQLGFSAVPADCERVLFTPVDIPLTAPSTIRRLVECTEPLVYPSFRGRRGHPVSFCAELLPALLQYRGEGGLKGALSSLPVHPSYLPVDDPFIRMDMDTRADYQNLLKRIGETDHGIETQHVEFSQLAAKPED